MTMIRRLLQTTLESYRQPSRSLMVFVKHHTMSVLAVVGIVVSLLLIAGVHALSMRLYHSMALQGTQIQVSSLMALQELYADRLLTSAQQPPQVIETSMVGAEEAAPCPSAFANELGLRLAEKYPGSLARECSEHPFNSEGPSSALDAFQTEAIRYLSAHPQEDYYQFATFAERPSLRLAMATRMDKSCVRCHNAHPDSPKRDWRVGDVAGILEFVRPLGDSVAAVRGNLHEMLALVIPAMALSLCGVGWVIQSLRRRTAELEKSESRNRAFLDASRDCVVTADHAGRVIEFNPAAERIFGYRRADLVGKDLAEFLIPPALRERHREGMRRFLASGQGRSLGQPIETQGLRADGTKFPIELTITAVHLNGNYLFTASIHDITQRKRRQAELEETNLRLIQSSRMAGKAEMATGVLHDVGNAMNSINVSVNLLNRQLKTSQVNGLSKACALMDQHAEDLGQFMSQDVRGRRLPDYLKQLATQLAAEKDATIRELGSLVESVDHVKEIVAVQQSYARISGLFEPIDVARLAADAVKMNEVSLAPRHPRRTGLPGLADADDRQTQGSADPDQPRLQRHARPGVRGPDGQAVDRAG